MLRSFLEKATRSSSFRRALPTHLGGTSIYVSGSAGLKYLFRPMEFVDPALCELAQEFVARDHVVWDVGANIGLFSFASAHLAGQGGKVFAFEPDVWLVQLLRRSVSIQPSSSASVQVVPAAVAGSCDMRTFNIAVRSRATNSLAGYGHGQTGGIAEQQTVMTVSLDWLAERLPLPDVIKIDVEGAELEVLSGALGLLRKKSPVILCEVCSERSQEVTELLKGAGYCIYDGEALPAKRQEVAAAPWSTVAIHASQNPSWPSISDHQ
jgi:FkbM family methyltransferase